MSEESIDQSILFIINPEAGAGKTGKNWDKMRQKINSIVNSIPVTYQIADGIGSGLTATIDGIQDGHTLIVGVGGEGTINEVCNGIYQSNNGKTKLGFIRSGTVNDYLTEINWPKSLEDQVKLLIRGKSRKTPLTVVDGDIRRVAINMVDAGVSALTAYMASVERRLLWVKGGFRYTLLALRAIRKWKNIPMIMKADDRDIEGDLSLFMAGYSTTIGKYRALPHAELFGEKLAYTSANNFSKLKMIRLMGALKKGKFTEDIEGVAMGHASKITIKAEEPVILEVDGEPFSFESKNIEIQAINDAIDVITPE